MRVLDRRHLALAMCLLNQSLLMNVCCLADRKAGNTTRGSHVHYIRRKPLVLLVPRDSSPSLAEDGELLSEKTAEHLNASRTEVVEMLDDHRRGY